MIRVLLLVLISALIGCSPIDTAMLGETADPLGQTACGDIKDSSEPPGICADCKCVELLSATTLAARFVPNDPQAMVLCAIEQLVVRQGQTTLYSGPVSVDQPLWLNGETAVLLEVLSVSGNTQQSIEVTLARGVFADKPEDCP